MAEDEDRTRFEVEQAPFKLTKGMENVDAGSKRHWAGAVGRFANATGELIGNLDYKNGWRAVKAIAILFLVALLTMWAINIYNAGNPR